MTGTDPSVPAHLTPAQETSPTSQPTAGLESDRAAESSAVPPEAAGAPDGDEASAGQRRRILIGSQRDPAAYRARRHRDWTPVEEPEAGDGAGEQSEGPKEGGRRRRRRRGGRGQDRGTRGPGEAAPAEGAPTPTAPASPAAPAVAPAEPVTPPTVAAAAVVEQPSIAPPSPVAAVAPKPQVSPPRRPAVPPALARPPVSSAVSSESAEELAAELSEAVAEQLKAAEEAAAGARVARPSRRDKLTPELEDEFTRAVGGVSMDELMAGAGAVANQTLLEPESKHKAVVVAVRRDDVFLELGGREQGVLPLSQLCAPPNNGDVFDVVVQRFNAEEGLYDLALPNTAVDLENWDEVSEGMLVETTVTGQNAGGLECQVNHLRGFIPVSQIALYRVEDLEQFVGQHFTCIIIEANRERRNLVLSRRAVLEREKEETRKNFFDSLQVGQVHQGTVRKLMPFGAFVDIGGAEGLLHISQLSWGRVNHPSDVLTEGQAIQVRIEKIDRETGKIGFSYRELLENPWSTAASKYPPNTVVKGKAVKLMEFGAFVELEPGVEGLIHISELSPKRVWRVADVVKEGDEVEAMVLSVNSETQRISLSIKALTKPVEPTKKEKEQAQAAELPTAPAKRKARPTGPLQGGLGKVGGGAKFGLKW